MKRRNKILLTGLSVPALILAAFGILTIVFCIVPAMRFRKFARAHATDAARVREDVEKVLQREKSAAPGRDLKKTPRNAALPNDPDQAMRDLLRESRPVVKELYPLVDGYLISVRTFHLQLAGGDYPDEQSGGASRGRAALERRVAEAAAASLSGEQIFEKDYWRKYPEKAAMNEALVTSLTARLQPMIDRAEAILSREDPAGLNGASYDTAMKFTEQWQFEHLWYLAVMRANLRGEHERAGRMLENLMKIQIRTLFQFSAKAWQENPRLWTEAMLMALGELDDLAPDGLERVASLLAAARLNEQQARRLRAAYVMELNNYSETVIRGKNEGFGGRLAQGVNWAASASGAAIFKSVGKVWAEGDEQGYYDAAARISLIKAMAPFSGFDQGVYRMFPPQDAAGSLENPFNAAIDRMRLIVAAARYRKAHGRYPERLEALAPDYLDHAFFESQNSCWGLARMEAGEYPGDEFGGGISMKSALADRFLEVLKGYREKNHRLPQNAEELRPFAKDEAELDGFRERFIPLAARPVFYHVRRFAMPQAYLQRLMKYQVLGARFMDELMRRAEEGRKDVEILEVDGFCWANEACHPERLALLKGDGPAGARAAEGKAVAGEHFTTEAGKQPSPAK